MARILVGYSPASGHIRPGPLRDQRPRGTIHPFADLLPHVDVVVTNGGYGRTQQALAHGVPVVVAGVSEGKNEVAARVS